jgi:hypothetical protein
VSRGGLRTLALARELADEATRIGFELVCACCRGGELARRRGDARLRRVAAKRCELAREPIALRGERATSALRFL